MAGFVGIQYHSKQHFLKYTSQLGYNNKYIERERVKTMALVEEYKIGNTTIKIYNDAYKDKTQEDIDRILERIAQIAKNAYEKEYGKGNVSVRPIIERS